MTFRLRITPLLLASLCICLVISASPSARSQGLPANTQQGPSAQSEEQPPNTDSAPVKECGGVLVTRESTYGQFIHEVGSWEAEAKELIEQGKDPNVNQVSYPVKPIYRKRFHWIGEDDFNTLYNVVIDAARQIDANNHEFDLAIEPLTEDRRNRVQAAEEKFRALAEAEGEKHRVVVEEAMARLERELTEEGFKKADKYIYDRYGGGRIEYRHRCLPSERQDPDPTPAPNTFQGRQR